MLAKNTQRFILYTAFAQSILLLVIHELIDRDAWPASSMPLRVLWYTLTLALPTAVSLLLREVRDRRFWTLLGVYGLVLVPLALHAGGQYVPEHHTEAWVVFFPYVLTQLALWFLVTFFVEAAQDGGHFWHTPRDVCAYAWRNFLTLVLLALFFGVLMMVLGLWAALFKLLNIDFFHFLFFESHRFIYPFFGVAGGIGVLIVRRQANVVDLMEKIAGALLRILLPLVALIAVLFLVTLPFTGVQLLWKTGQGTFLMMWLVCLMLLLVNVSRQHERDSYQRILEWVVRITFLLLPVYLALSAWGIGLRVAQYGWSHERLWTVVILSLQACFVVAYILAMNLPGRSWVERLPALNKNLGALVAVVLVLVNTPFLDLRRLTTADQVARLEAGKVTLAKFDFPYLRFRLGEYGYQGVAGLSQSPLVAGKADQIAYLQELLKADNWWRMQGRGLREADSVKSAIKILPEGASAPPELLDRIASTESGVPSHDCADVDKQSCKLIRVDVTGEQQPEYLFVRNQPWEEVVSVFELVSGKWTQVATLSVRAGQREAFVASVAAGHFTRVKPQFDDIVVDGIRYRLDPNRDPIQYGPGRD